MLSEPGTLEPGTYIVKKEFILTQKKLIPKYACRNYNHWRRTPYRAGN